MRNQARLDERLKMRSSQYRDCQYGAEQELSREKSAPPHLESPDHESDVLKSAIRRGCVESGKTVVPAAAMLLTATAIIHIGHRLMSGNIKK
jgi:hypothetical protein